MRREAEIRNYGLGHLFASSGHASSFPRDRIPGSAAQQVTPEDAIRMALEQRARGGEVDAETFAARQALTDAFKAKIAALPELDPRSPPEITDDLDPL
jgi:hypothetical protein